jgi:hypothetical protein
MLFFLLVFVRLDRPDVFSPEYCMIVIPISEVTVIARFLGAGKAGHGRKQILTST